MEPGTVSEGQLVAALREVGFDYVFDTNFTADLTIMEEGTELLKRIKAGGSRCSALEGDCSSASRPPPPLTPPPLAARAVPHVHVVLPGVGQPGGEVLPGVLGEPLLLQVPAGHAGHPGQGALPQTAGQDSRRCNLRLHHAVHREKGRNGAAAAVGRYAFAVGCRP